MGSVEKKSGRVLLKSDEICVGEAEVMGKARQGLKVNAFKRRERGRLGELKT